MTAATLERTTSDTSYPAYQNGAQIAHGLDSVLPHAAKDDALPTLCAVQLTADGDTLTLAATDRYTLGTITVPYSGPAFTFLLDRPDAVTLAKLLKVACKIVAESVTLTVDGDRLTVATFDTTVTYRQVAGEFPRWGRLIPSGEPDATDTIAWGGANLAKFCKLTDPDTGSRTPAPLRVTLYGSHKPARVDVGRFVGLIMPVRIPS